MGPIPEDLIVFLFFGLFVLIQIVRAQRRKKARRAAVPAAAPVEVQAEAADTTTLPMPWIAEPAEPPRPQPPARARPLTPAAAPDSRRFSRRRLLGDRRSLQDAIVVATVLGPCLAQRPRDAE